MVALAAVAVAALGVTPQSGAAQSQEEELRRLAQERLGRPVTDAEIIDQLRNSGMTRGQVRQRLQQMGYDPSLADRYFDAVEAGGGGSQSQADPGMVDALSSMGVQLRNGRDSTQLIVDRTQAERDSAIAEAERSRIFGKMLFARATSEFEPPVTGAVSEDYPLGPGDEVWLILTGDVERSYPLTVTREGFLIIPQVGQVPVHGLTLEQLEDRLYTYLGRAYSGVRRGPEATTQFQVTLGQMRASHVFVVGEAERPSGYQVSPMARVFNALYRAGGPNENGSFRRIIVRRNGQQVAEVDLYPYLLAGEPSGDIRLEQGDMVFVPVTGPRVTVEGEVRRTGIYEIRPGEGLRDVLAFAGGIRPEAVVQRVQIDRILPPEQREPGKDRTLVDVDVSAVFQEGRGQIDLRDGDIVTLFSVSEERRNRVAITGGVRRPGHYEWEPGLTLEELLRRADGLREGAYTSRALLYRLQEDNTRRLLRAHLDTAAPADIPLMDRDSVVVLLEDSLRLPRVVSVVGYVKEPGEYALAEGMSVRDLILAAGGFVEGANTVSAEVARGVDPGDRTSESAEVFDVPLTGPGNGTAAGIGYRDEDGVPRWAPEAAEIELRRGDRVYVRRAPGYEEARAVQLTGEVMMPGAYELDRRQTRVAEVLRRAGGLTPEAYPEGFTIIRDSVPVAVNLPEALRDPSSSGNILLQAGDSLHMPGFDGTVNVTGAVVFDAKVLYESGRSLRHYINRAGGFTEHADEDAVVVTYPNGQRAVAENFLLFKRRPRIQPGSTITVPELPPSEREGLTWSQIIGQTSATLGTLATLLVLIDRIGN